MLIKNGTIFQEDKTFAKKDIYIENGKITAIMDSGSNMIDAGQIYDASGLYVLSGLIDIHSHGAVGHDFSDGDLEGLQEILRYQYANGITSYCPTSMTLPKNYLLELFKKVKEWEGCSKDVNPKRQIRLSHVVGYNMEGPFLDTVKKGAHKEEDIILPDIDWFKCCNEASGKRICLVTVAPNVKGGIEFIERLSHEENITISLGHTSADYATAREALIAGASHVTHLFNAMVAMNHREPGLIGAAMDDERCMVELICDGVHVHESMVRAAFKLFADRIVLISDSMRATGLADGIYELGGQQVSVTKNRAILSDGTIAGSVTNLFDCMCRAISYGIAPEEAIAAVTMNPAKSIGIYEEVGSLTVGKRADIILVDKEFHLVRVF